MTQFLEYVDFFLDSGNLISTDIISVLGVLWEIKFLHYNTGLASVILGEVNVSDRTLANQLTSHRLLRD